MTLQSWIDWCQKQLGDLSVRLFRQGYHPARIEHLNRVSPEFRDRYEHFLNRINEVMDDMAQNPDGYHHFDEFMKAKTALLEFTNLHREQFLMTDYANIA